MSLARMPARLRQLNPDPAWGMESAQPAAALHQGLPHPPYRRRPPIAWLMGFAFVAAGVALLAAVAVNEEFTDLQEQLRQARQASALWTACRPPRQGERLAVYLEHSTVVGGMEYTCVYDEPRRKGVLGRRSVTRVVSP